MVKEANMRTVNPGFGQIPHVRLCLEHARGCKPWKGHVSGLKPSFEAVYHGSWTCLGSIIPTSQRIALLLPWIVLIEINVPSTNSQ